MSTQLQRLNSALSGAVSQQNASPQLPIIFVIGAPRSGTTLMLQWLTSLGCFAYASNLASRFYSNPYVGGLAHRALLEEPESRVLKTELTANFQSVLGKTTGPHAPNEFWHFWRECFHIHGNDVSAINKDLLVENKLFEKGLAGLEEAFERPLALKGLILNWHLAELASLLPSSHFIFVSRNTADNAYSLYQAREKFFSTASEWYSFQYPGYAALKNLEPEEQVVRQVQDNNAAISDGLRHLATERVTTISYEAFCDDPSNLYARIREVLGPLGSVLSVEYHGPECFERRTSYRSGATYRNIKDISSRHAGGQSDL